MSIRPHVKRGGSMRFCCLFLVVISSLIFRISSASEPVNTGLYLPAGEGLKSLPRLGRRNGGDFIPQSAKEVWSEPYNSLSTFPNRNSIFRQRYGGDSIGLNSNAYLSVNDMVLTTGNGFGISPPKYLLWKKIFSGTANELRSSLLAKLQTISASGLRPENGLERDVLAEEANDFVNLRERL